MFGKATDAKRSIGQASKEIGVPEATIRFWETQFPNSIQPTLGLGGRRYYYNKDIKILKTIKEYLYEKGYTIKGLQTLLENDANMFNNQEETSNQQQNLFENTITKNNEEQKKEQTITNNFSAPTVKKEYVYINTGLDKETKEQLNNFKQKLINFGIMLENI